MSILDKQQTNQNGAKSSEINVLIKFVSVWKLRSDVRLHGAAGSLLSLHLFSLALRFTTLANSTVSLSLYHFRLLRGISGLSACVFN